MEEVSRFAALTCWPALSLLPPDVIHASMWSFQSLDPRFKHQQSSTHVSVVLRGQHVVSLAFEILIFIRNARTYMLRTSSFRALNANLTAATIKA